MRYRDLLSLIRSLDAYHDLAQELGRENPLYTTQTAWYDMRTKLARLMFVEGAPKLNARLPPELERLYNELREQYVVCEEQLVTA